MFFFSLSVSFFIWRTRYKVYGGCGIAFSLGVVFISCLRDLLEVLFILGWFMDVDFDEFNL